jgi:hypothetical protein
MAENDPNQAQGDQKNDDGKLEEMLQEIRILLQGAQVLTAFLIILPFNAGFDKLNDSEKWLYLVTFVCSLTSLVFFTAPAAIHRLARPVQDRKRYKDLSTRLLIIGMVFASLALILSSQIAVSAVMGEPVSWIVAGIAAAVIGALWWVIPIMQRDKL